jgi:hypothetical protein
MERKPFNIYQINLFKNKYNFGKNKIGANRIIISLCFLIIISLPWLVNITSGSNLWDVILVLFSNVPQ